MNKKVKLAAGIGMVILAAVLIFLRMGEKPVITVNGDAVYEDEYTFLTKVSTGISGETGGRERVTALKCEQQLLKSYNIVEDISYDGFLEEVKQVNRERKEELERGGHVYGPETYTAQIYYDYKYSEARETLIRQVLMGEIKDPEADQNNNADKDGQEQYQTACRRYRELVQEIISSGMNGSK